MPKSPDTSTIIATGEQLRATIPKPIGEALKLQAGQKLRWRHLGKDRLEVTVIKSSNQNKE